MAGLPLSSYAGIAQQAAPIINSFIPQDSIGGGTASGALQGASIGMALGPWGALAGGVIGGAAGFFGAKKRKDEERKLQEQIRARNYQNIISNSQGVLAGYPSQGIVEAKYGGRFNFGGYMSPIKGGRAIPLADGVTLYDGRTHEQGGILLPNNAEIEDAEVIKEDKVYSDSLKPKGSSKTYAELAEELGRKKGKYDSDLNSPNQTKATTAKLMSIKYDNKLESLFNIQEESKMKFKFGQYRDGGKFKSSTPLVGKKFVIDPTVDRVESETKPNYLYNKFNRTNKFDPSRPELLYSLENEGLARLMSNPNAANAITAFDVTNKDYQEVVNNMHFTESMKNPLLRTETPARQSAIKEFNNAPALRKLKFGEYDTKGLVDGPRYTSGVAKRGEALTIEVPEFESPELDTFVGKMDRFKWVREPQKSGYAGDGPGKGGSYSVGGAEWKKKSFNDGGVMDAPFQNATPSASKFNFNPDSLLSGLNNLMPIAGQLINNRFINKMETEVPYTEVAGPRYNYTSRVPGLRNMYLSAFRDANNAVKTGSQQYNAGLRGSLYAQTLNQMNQAYDSEISRKDAIDANFNNQLQQTNAANTQIRNNALTQSMINRNQKTGLKQQNIDNTIKGLMGNYTSNEMRKLDLAKSWLVSSQAGNTGVDTRLFEQMPEWMRKYFNR
jgi:hypothetical protein